MSRELLVNRLSFGRLEMGIFHSSEEGAVEWLDEVNAGDGFGS